MIYKQKSSNFSIIFSLTGLSNVFTADDKVVHLAHRIDKFNYKFCCGITVGGILILKAKQFYFINGFSNQYYVSVFLAWLLKLINLQHFYILTLRYKLSLRNLVMFQNKMINKILKNCKTT